MKYIKTYEKFDFPSEEQLREYNIKAGDYVIANDKFDSIGPWFINDLIQNEIGKIRIIAISNLGHRNEEIFCDVQYEDIPREITKHISGQPFIFSTPVSIKYLRKVSDKEYKEYKLKKDINNYNL